MKQSSIEDKEADSYIRRPAPSKRNKKKRTLEGSNRKPSKSPKSSSGNSAPSKFSQQSNTKKS